jgi:hypothetical protein
MLRKPCQMVRSIRFSRPQPSRNDCRARLLTIRASSTSGKVGDTVREVTCDEVKGRILFFVSLGERYVEIIADHETHARVPSNVWNRMIGDFMTAVTAGRVADRLLGAIESCGSILKTHYPLRD